MSKQLGTVDIDELVSGEDRAIEDALRTLALEILGNVKSTPPLMEELLKNAIKYHKVLEQCIGAATAFIDAFAKLADRARYARGATNQLGESLHTLLECQRHAEALRLEQCAKLKADLIVPLAERCQSDRAAIAKMEKKYEKETRRGRDTLKKFGKQTMKAAERARKGKTGARTALEEMAHQMGEATKAFQVQQLANVSSFFIDERSTFVSLYNLYRPVVLGQLETAGKSMEIDEHLRSIDQQAANPDKLPADTRSILDRIMSGDTTFISRSSVVHILDPLSMTTDAVGASLPHGLEDDDDDDDDGGVAEEHRSLASTASYRTAPSGTGTGSPSLRYPPQTVARSGSSNGLLAPDYSQQQRSYRSPALSIRSGSSGSASLSQSAPPPPPPPAIPAPVPVRRAESICSSVSAHSTDRMSSHSGAITSLAPPPPPPPGPLSPSTFSSSSASNRSHVGNVSPASKIMSAAGFSSGSPGSSPSGGGGGGGGEEPVLRLGFGGPPSDESILNARKRMTHVHRPSIAGRKPVAQDSTSLARPSSAMPVIKRSPEETQRNSSAIQTPGRLSSSAKSALAAKLEGGSASTSHTPQNRPFSCPPPKQSPVAMAPPPPPPPSAMPDFQLPPPPPMDDLGNDPPPPPPPPPPPM